MIGTPTFTARKAAPSNSGVISGPLLRVPSGNTATGEPLRSAASSARSAPRSAVPRSTRTAPSAVNSRARIRLANSSSFARKATVRRVMKAANGTSRIDRWVGATM